MDKISKVVIKPLQKSIYLKPYTMHFTQNGSKRTWDLLTIHDSVAVVIFNTSRKVLIMVKQFRPAVYYCAIPLSDRKENREVDISKYPPDNGITIELCAGLVDKKLPLVEIAKEEILEECGYDVPLSKIEKIGTYCSGVGTSGSLQTAFYCEVTDAMKVSAGGGVGDEIIEVIEMTVDEVKRYINQSHIKSPPSFMYGMYWFLYNKAKK